MPLVSTMLRHRHFAPDHVCIPGRQQTHQYNIADVDPWVIQRINTRTIMTTTLEVLSRAHLITAQNTRDLMAALPWNALTGANIPGPMSFEITSLGIPDREVFGVSPALIRSDLYLALVVERKNGRSHAGARWKQIRRLFLIAMREGWCDPDLLLDPYFLHFPKRTDEVAWYPGIEARSANLADPQLHRREPADLIEALAECDAADPWRTRYRLHHASHPARRIACLAGKFFNMAALNPNVPPLPPQP
ncbi:hypothetical protein PHMEG_00032213 [Phytophthora megakarya]|uniref:Uncharacterized protein n=1 Tax=Phytophthora megakarya TaxID=4795 RepID=A0A225UWV3_9STRA|nr:hypothetical protein PHMEG_00032213 [Phytophthora megakarya]